MSRRWPKAPLLEVIFEIRWASNNEDVKNRYQYLHGDLYNAVKSDFPKRELIVPSHFPVEVYLNQVAHRFRKSEGGYPLMQIGPGIFTYNTVEKDYLWTTFCEQIVINAEKLISQDSFNSELPVDLALRYIDFFHIDFKTNDVIDYFKEYLHIKVEQEFFKNDKPPYSVNLGFTYGTQYGIFSLTINKGLVNSMEGLIIQIEVLNQGMSSNISNIIKWLNDAHTITSEAFDNLTKGKLQELFNS